MKKFLKIFAIVFALLFAVLIIIPFAFKGKILDLVKTQINKSVNAEVTFNNDISLSIIKSFPNFTLGIDDFQIIGRDTFQNDTFAQIKSLELKMDLMSVISGTNIEIKQIHFDEPTIHIKVLKDGRANYDLVYPDSIETIEETPPYKIALKNLEINKGNLIYDDKSIDFYLGLNGIENETQGDFTLSKFLLETNTTVNKTDMRYGDLTLLSKIKTEINTILDMDLNEMRFGIKENETFLNNIKINADGWYQLYDEKSDMDLKFSSPTINLKSLLSLVPKTFLKDLEGINANGNVDFNAFVKGELTDNNIPSFNLNLNVNKGNLKYPDLPGQVKDIQLAARLSNPGGNANNTIVNISKFHSNINGDEIDAKLLVKTPISDPNVNLELKGEVDLTNLNKSLKLENKKLTGDLKANVKASGKISSIEKKQYQEFIADGNLSISNFNYQSEENGQEVNVKTMALDFSPKEVNLTNLEGLIGKSDFKINGRLDNFYNYIFGDKKLKGNINLNSNYLNLNPFLSDDTEDNNNPQAEDTVELEAIDIPENFDLTLNSTIKTLIYDNLKLNEAKGEIIVKDKKLYLNNVFCKVFDGTVLMSGIYDSKIPKAPFTDLKLNVKNFNIQESFKYMDILKKLGPVSKYVTGLFSANVNMKSNLSNNLSPDYKSLNAEGTIRLSEAVVSGFEALDQLGEKLNIEAFKNLELKNLAFGIIIKDGKIELKDTLRLPIKNNILKLSGFSSLDQSLKYTGLMDIPRKQLGSANTLWEELSNKASKNGLNLDLASKIPVLINLNGTITKPKISINLNEAKKSLIGGIKNQVKNQVDQKKEEVKETLKEKKEEVNEKIDLEKEKRKQEILAEANKQTEAIKSLAKENAEKARQLSYDQADAIIEKAKSKSFIEQKVAERSALELKKKGDFRHHCDSVYQAIEDNVLLLKKIDYSLRKQQEILEQPI